MHSLEAMRPLHTRVPGKLTGDLKNVPTVLRIQGIELSRIVRILLGPQNSNTLRRSSNSYLNIFKGLAKLCH